MLLLNGYKVTVLIDISVQHITCIILIFFQNQWVSRQYDMFLILNADTTTCSIVFYDLSIYQVLEVFRLEDCWIQYILVFNSTEY